MLYVINKYAARRKTDKLYVKVKYNKKIKIISKKRILCDTCRHFSMIIGMLLYENFALLKSKLILNIIANKNSLIFTHDHHLRTSQNDLQLSIGTYRKVRF